MIDRLTTFIGTELYDAGHRGHAGIDAMIYKSGEQYKFKPVVEINPRMTMGTISLSLKKHISTTGVFWISPKSKARIMANDSVIVKNGKLHAGVVNLTPPDGRFIAQLGVGEQSVNQWLNEHGPIRSRL